MTIATTHPTTLHVHADHLQGTHLTDSDDFVRWWLPTLGPTSTLLARLLAASVADTGAHDWDTDELAALLGLSTVRTALWRSLERLAYWRLATFASPDTLTIRVTARSLTKHQLDAHPHAQHYNASPVA